MTNATIPRYPSTYRQAELRLICDYARRSQSLCLVGVAGIGKSNITNFLRFDPYHYKAQYLGAESATLLFPFVDGNAWDGTPQRLWELLLEDLVQLTRDLPAPPNDGKMMQISEEQRTFSALRSYVQWLTNQQQRQIMFILDDFDHAFRAGPLAMLEQLNTLRSAGNRNKLSYLIFTKRLPHVLGRALPLDDNSKFYGLFKNDIYALEPYEQDDTAQMLVFLNEKADKPLSTEALAQIGEELSGGHAGLAKTIFEHWRRELPTPGVNLILFFAQKPDIRDECRRIIEQLHPDEQKAIYQLVQGQAADVHLVDHLERRGLLQKASKVQCRSAVLEEYLCTSALSH